MAQINVTQTRRIVFRKYNPTTKEWGVELVFEPDDLGQDTQMTINVAPRKKSRSSSMGTTETPIPGTFDALAATISFVMDTYRPIGLALNRWNKATYEGADPNSGNVIFGAGDNLCEGGEYVNVVAQGVCDDGSSVDVEITRCTPSIPDDIEFGNTEAATVTMDLNPIIYNHLTHEGDGYPAYTIRLGDQDLTQKTRLNVTTGEYEPVTPPEVGA